MQQQPFHPRKDPRPDIEKALDRAIELSTGSRRYHVSRGQLASEKHGRYSYSFVLESSWDLPDGTTLQLTSPDFEKPLLAELTTTKDDSVLIATTQRLPERTLSLAQLVVDRAYLLRKLQAALNQELVPATPAQLGLKLYGHLDCPDETAESSLIDVISDVFLPDEAQRLAIQRALASELLMLLGPPGTGKTDVLAAIAMLHALLYNHRVLIASHTNIAIDNALIRLVNCFRKHGMTRFIEEQCVIRFGSPQLAELETDDYRSVTLSSIVDDATIPQREKIAQLERRREQMLDQLDSLEKKAASARRAWEQRKKAIPRELKRAKADLEAVEAEEQRRLAPILEQLTLLLAQDTEAKQQIEQAQTREHADKTLLPSLQQAYQRQLVAYQTERKKLDQLQRYGRVSRFLAQHLTGEQESELEARVLTLTTSLQEQARQIERIQQSLAEALRSAEQAREHRKKLSSAIAYREQQRTVALAVDVQEKRALLQEIEELEHEWEAGNTRIDKVEQEIAQKKKERSWLEDTLAYLDQQVADTRREVARKATEAAQIVGATLTSLYLNPILLRQEWDAVIVDEGSMAPAPAVLLAANRARSHLVIVGDPLQLAPVCKLKDPQVKSGRKEDDIVQLWLGCDVFFHGNYTLEEAATGAHHSVLLPYQGRMHTQICDLIREPVYKGRLKDRNPQSPRPKMSPEPEHPVILYDTSGEVRARAQQPASKRSRFNLYQAEISVHLARLALADLPETDRKPECIGIVTPYAAQRNYIKERIANTDLAPWIRVGTVHAFQGLEFPIVIFDLVESPGLLIARFLQGGWGSDAMRLLNVAVTRARHKLLIVANRRYICHQEPSTSMLRQIIELAREKKCIPTESFHGARKR